LGLIREEERLSQEGGSPYFILQASPEAELPEMEPYLPAVGQMEKADLVILELAATFDAFRELGSDHEQALGRLRHKKAGKWSEERETRALDLLRRLGLSAA